MVIVVCDACTVRFARGRRRSWSRRRRGLRRRSRAAPIGSGSGGSHQRWISVPFCFFLSNGFFFFFFFLFFLKNQNSNGFHFFSPLKLVYMTHENATRSFPHANQILSFGKSLI